MPEGHTVHRLARRHTKLLRGKAVRVTSPQGRFVDAALVDGHVFTGAEAWGKHLFHAYDNGLFVHVHLGIYGESHERELGSVRKDTPRMRIATAVVLLDLIGPPKGEVTDEDRRARSPPRSGRTR